MVCINPFLLKEKENENAALVIDLNRLFKWATFCCPDVVIVMKYLLIDEAKKCWVSRKLLPLFGRKKVSLVGWLWETDYMKKSLYPSLYEDMWCKLLKELPDFQVYVKLLGYQIGLNILQVVWLDTQL